MANRPLTDEEVFGTPAPAADRPLTDEEVFGAAPQPTGPGASSLRYGAAATAQNVGSTLDVLGQALDVETLRGWGRRLRGAVNEPRGYVPSSPAVAERLNQGDLRGAAGNVPGAVVENLPGMGAVIGAGALGTVMGGPVGGLLAAGLMSGAQTFGPIAEQRAQNQNVPVTDPGNLAVAGTATAGIAALDAATGMGHRLFRPLREAPQGLVRRAGQAGAVAGAEGVAEAAQEGIQMAATGDEFDPGRLGAAGLIGGATRGATAVPGAVMRGAVESTQAALAGRAFGDMTPEMAESVVRVTDRLESDIELVRQRTGRTPDPEDVLNAMRAEVRQQLRDLVRHAEANDWVDNASGYREGEMLRELVDTAARHNREMVDGLPTEDFHLGSGLGQIDRLRRAPPVFRQNLRALLTDLDVLSRAARKKNLTGPFEQAGRALGGAAGVGGAVAMGGSPLQATVLALGGSPTAARAGAYVGSLVDRALGTRRPAITMVRRQAERMVRRLGRDPGRINTMLGELDRILTDERLAARAAMGLPTDADTMARLAAEAAVRRADRMWADREAVIRQADTIGTRAEEAAARERAWQDYERRFRQPGATPEQVQAILDTVRRAENAAKGRDLARANREAPADPNLDAVTRSQVREWERFLADARRSAQARRRAAEALERAANQQAEPDAPQEASQEAAQAATRRVRRPRTQPAAEPAQPSPEPAQAPPVPAPPPAAPVPQDVAPAPPPQADMVETPNDRPGARERGAMFGWQRYIQVSFRNKGRDVSRQETLDAVDALEESGDLLPDEAALLRDGQADRAPRRVLNTMMTLIAAKQGWDFEGTPDAAFGAPGGAAGGGPGSPGYYAGVDRPASWQGAADARQDHIRFYREQAVQAGDMGLAETLGRLGTSTSAQISPENRQAIARAVVRAGTDAQRPLRRAAMAPWLEGEDFPDAPAAQPEAPAQPDAQPASEPRRRGRPRRQPEPAPPTEAAQEQAPSTVTIGNQVVPADDALLARAERVLREQGERLRPRIMEGDDAALDALRRIEEQVDAIRRANAAWRAEVSKGE